MPLIRDALSAIGAPGRFALLGAVSGSVAITLITVLPNSDYQPLKWLVGLLPGWVFGLIIGLALYRGGHAGPRTFAAYVAASTVSFLAALYLAIGIYDYLGPMWPTDPRPMWPLDSPLMWPTGMIAGLFGSACLTGLAAWMFPFARKFRPIALMLFAGCILGALLGIGGGFWWGLVFYAGWQAGYAAAFATALPEAAAPDSARVSGGV